MKWIIVLVAIGLLIYLFRGIVDKTTKRNLKKYLIIIGLAMLMLILCLIIISRG